MWLTWLIIILAIIGIIIIIKLVTGAVKIIIYALALLVIIGVILGILIVVDATRFKNDFLVKEKDFLLIDDGKILAGFRTTAFEENQYFTASELSDFQDLLDKKDYKAIRAEEWKLFIFNIDVFNEYFNRNLELPHSFYNVSGEFFREVLVRENPKDFFIERFLNETKNQYGNNMDYDSYEKQLESYFGTDEVIKGKLFNTLMQEAIVDKSFLFIIKDVRKGDVIVEPETILFKALKFTPKNMFNRTLLNIRIERVKSEIIERLT